ncbi:MAG: hypothetical protein KAV00_11995 [Phycisphaerae bacterium]|nr:hypothetical protein [Phycisphaerae bacterium]
MSKKKGIKINVAADLSGWIDLLERQTSTTRTRLFLASLLAFASRTPEEQSALLSLATMLDKGEMSWGRGLALLKLENGVVSLSPQAVKMLGDRFEGLARAGEMVEEAAKKGRSARRRHTACGGE